MDARYDIQDTSEIVTPALIVFRELVEENIDLMIQIARRVDRLRPHCKTHKIREVAELQLQKGITKHKCATLAEAEMLADAGADDIFLAYNPVGPNIGRAVSLQAKYPNLKLAVTADHPGPIAALGAAASDAGQVFDVLLDIDTGLHRTGLKMDPAAEAMYGRIANTAGLRAAGLHVYDGHIHDRLLDDRRGQSIPCGTKSFRSATAWLPLGWPCRASSRAARGPFLFTPSLTIRRWSWSRNPGILRRRLYRRLSRFAVPHGSCVADTHRQPA